MRGVLVGWGIGKVLLDGYMCGCIWSLAKSPLAMAIYRECAGVSLERSIQRGKESVRKSRCIKGGGVLSCNFPVCILAHSPPIDTCVPSGQALLCS